MAKKKSWKKLRPDSNQELEDALLEERRVTALVYDRMSGRVPWGPGERERLNARIDELSARINPLIAEQVVNSFAALPDE